jgi:hypothetical protein
MNNGSKLNAQVNTLKKTIEKNMTKTRKGFSQVVKSQVILALKTKPLKFHVQKTTLRAHCPKNITSA